MINRVLLLLHGALSLASGGFAFSSARAQDDDWAITRSAAPASHRSLRKASEETDERRLQRFVTHPDNELAFERLVASQGVMTGGLSGLEQRLRLECERRPAALEPTLALARLLLARDRWDDARELLAGVLAGGRDPARTLWFRARLARMHGLVVEARGDLVQLLARPATPLQRQQALRALGELALDEGEIEQARAYYRELAANHASDWERASEFPRALVKLGLHADAAAAYRELIARFHGSKRWAALLSLELARAALASGDFEGALGSLRHGRELDSRLAPELRTLEVDALRGAGRLEEAALQREREAKAGRSAAWREAAALWQEQTNGARAVLCLRALLERQPNDLDVRAELARSLRRESELASAEVEYRELVRRAPAAPAFVSGLAELLNETGQRDAALAVLARAALRNPRAPALHATIRELYVRWGEHEFADRELVLLTKLEPDNAAHPIALGERALATGDRKAALAAFAKLRRGSDARSEVAQARLLEQHDLIAEALPFARRAVELAPTEAEPQRVLASLLERASREPEAEAAWQAVWSDRAASEEVRGEARQHLIVLWRRSGRLAQRVDALELELTENPRDVERLRLLAELYARDPQKTQQEISLIERVLSERPSDPEALAALAEAQLRRGDVSAALRAVFLQLEPTCTGCAARVWHALELAHRYAHNEVSRRLVERASVLQPRDARVFASVGSFYALRSEWERARAAYERAVELDPRAFEARFALAEDALRRGELSPAREQLRAVIVGSSDDAQVEAALGLLPQPTGGRLEAWVLERAMMAPERAVVRRFVLERELRPWLPIARRGIASELERGQLAGRLPALSGLLFAAAGAPSADERLLAIPFLATLAHTAALDSLLKIAERSDRSLSERAEALLAVGSMRRESAAERLGVLARDGSRQLRPLALWALTASVGKAAGRQLQAALAQRDGATCAMAALLAGQLAEPSLVLRLRELVADPRETVRAAALWALTRSDRTAYEPVLASALAESSAVAAVAVAVLIDTPAYAADALLSVEPEVRRMAARLLTSTAVEPARLPRPTWPFDERSYLVEVARSHASARAFPSRAYDLALAAASLARLRGGVERVRTTLGLLDSQAGGLVPRAFVEVGVCVSSEHARGLAGLLQDSLAALSRSELPEVRARALTLLVRTGGAERAEVRSALASTDLAEIDAVLSAAAELSTLPSSLHDAIARLLEAPEWPTRMRAASALRHGLTSAQLAHDPIALVRSGGRKSQVNQRCTAENEGATN